jgi:hypothetical protein
MSELDLRALLAALHAGQVRFVVIGGVAVAAHGYLRATDDLDVVPDPDLGNLMRLSNALVMLEGTLPRAGGRHFDPARDAQQLRRGRSLTLDTVHGGLDVVQRVPNAPSFEDLDRDAVDSDLLGVPVRICSLAALRQMKGARGTTQDRADLENLPLAED